MLRAQIIQEREAWNALLLNLPYHHILQSWEWGAFKAETTGWQPTRYAYTNSAGEVIAAASVLTRRFGPLRLIYVPKGPVLDYADADLLAAVLDHLQALARRLDCIWLKIDPDLPLAYGLPSENADPKRPHQADSLGENLVGLLKGRGWRFSADQIQFRNTLTLDLNLTPEQLLAEMSQSTRRKLRKADAAGVVVREADLNGADFETLYQLYAETGARQGFLTRPLDYYRLAWLSFAQAGYGGAWLAEHEGRALAGAVCFYFGRKVWFFYGMTANEQGDLNANYALHWAIIQWARAAGYPLYDWWGAPNEFNENDPMWGVYRFKDGFGGEVVRHVGAWDYSANPALYGLYTQAAPRLMGFLRRLRGK